MALKAYLIIVCLGILGSWTAVQAACKSCSATSYAACTGERTFEICFDGQTKSGQKGNCSDDEVCTELQGICKKADTNVATCLSGCEVCNSGFACVTKTQYCLCDADDLPTTTLVTCPDNKYCNIDSFVSSQTMCVSTCDNTPTCDTEKNPEVDYKKSCTTTSVTGLYPNKSDDTCQTYVFCQVIDGTVYSVLYTCSTGYFDPTQKKCVANKPTGCV